MKNRIFSFDNPKAGKAVFYGWLNAIHYMAPADAAGVGNLCPFYSKGCKAACLGLYSGAATYYPAVVQSRIDKARRFMKDRNAYMRDVVRSIELAQRKAKRMGLRLCVRMNGSTDVAWEGIGVERIFERGKRDQGGEYWYRNLFEAFPDVQFVDYTKITSRLLRKRPSNYHITLSRSEVNEQECQEWLQCGVNVAVVFAGKLPQLYLGAPVISGDNHDLRHLDPRGGFVIGLTPKGNKAKRDTSGFVVRNLEGAL